MKFSSTSIILLRQVNKIWFLVTSGCQLSRKVWKEKIEVFCRPEWTEVMNLQKNFKYFQIQKWMLQTGRAEKVLRLNKDVKERWKYHLSTYLDEKNGVICVVFMFPSWIMILKLLKKCIFLILCWPQQKNLIIMNNLIHIWLRKVLLRTFEDISFWNRRILLNVCWVSIAFDILIC